MLRMRHDACTDTGRRSNNEDAFIAAPELGFYAVADGMGGYEGGEIASRTALDGMLAYLERVAPSGLDLEQNEECAVQQVQMAIRIAGREVRRRAVGELSQMGTTVACMLVRGSRALLAHVGDSRIYRLRDEELALMTRDHSVVAEMEAAGRSAAAHQYHIITRSLGPGPDARPDCKLVDVQPRDRFLLCTDGLTDVLSPPEIALELARTRGAARALVKTAYQMGTWDNITALVVGPRE